MESSLKHRARRKKVFENKKSPDDVFAVFILYTSYCSILGKNEQIPFDL